MTDEPAPIVGAHSDLNTAMVAVYKILKSKELSDTERANVEKARDLLMEAQSAYDYRTGAFDAWWDFYMPGQRAPVYVSKPASTTDE